ncbi:RIO1 family-domain-containing protein [Catenaria anguillulae PL171]|uniref:Serine/threonine-protein kinase RIO1 n=1 Tax=Catenaria anguillulae PL171 TaxID=765915 RepID=A0A1Y2HDW8_9FUNG|nr:RIO1 family-domain-containing protein [Catenaria anguillulae PL171]
MHSISGQFDDADDPTVAAVPTPQQARVEAEADIDYDDTYAEDEDDSYDYDTYDDRYDLHLVEDDYAAAATAHTIVDTRHLVHKMTDKADRATAEQVLDPRTRMILFKILNNGLVAEIHGCVSTGKEANVYHSVTKEGLHRAIKVYKTSILVFKDRDRYVTGEHRFKHGYAKRNPRKMVKVWAEKEMRNLKRLRAAGIPSPEPLLLKLHVLVMDFIGDSEGRAAPRLKDANLEGKRARSAYEQMIRIMWVLHNVCHLVHADLSEYNILWHKKQCVVIDVSQSVEHEHPQALEFLRKDCANITDFFRKKGVVTLSLRQLFDFVTDASLVPAGWLAAVEDAAAAARASHEAKDAMVEAAENLDKIEVAQTTQLMPLACPPGVDEEVKRLLALAVEQANTPMAQGELNALQVEEQVFKNAYVPRTLDEVVDMERDVYNVINKGRAGELVYKNLLAPKVVDEEQVESAPGSAKSKDSKKGGKASSDQTRSAGAIAKEKDRATRGKSKQSDAVLDALLNFSISDPSEPMDVPESAIVGHEEQLVLSDLEDEDEELELSDSDLSDSDMDSQGDDSGEDDSDDEDGLRRRERALRGKKHLDKDEKKKLKQAVKEEKREKRKTKVPKAVKKRKEKMNKLKSKK